MLLAPPTDRRNDPSSRPDASRRYPCAPRTTGLGTHAKRPRGRCGLRRVPRDLCVCTRPATHRSVERSAEHDLSRPCSRHPMASDDDHRAPEAFPKRAPSGSRPVPAPSAPSGFAPRSGPTCFTIRSHCCCTPVGAQPVFVSLRFEAVPPRTRRPPPSGWRLARAWHDLGVLVRLRRAVCSVWARWGERLPPAGLHFRLPSSRFPVRPLGGCLARRASFALDGFSQHPPRPMVKR